MTLEMVTYYCARCLSRWLATAPSSAICPFCHATHCEAINADSPYWRARLADEEAAA